MQWNETLSVGVKTLDDDHKKLVDMINELVDGITSNRRQEALSQIFDKLIHYTRFHFCREEEYFARTGYSAANHHANEHRELIRQVTDLQTRFKSGGASLLSLEVMKFLTGWLTHHIMVEDKNYRVHLNAHGIR